jgi:hypothetical protein
MRSYYGESHHTALKPTWMASFVFLGSFTTPRTFCFAKSGNRLAACAFRRISPSIFFRLVVRFLGLTHREHLTLVAPTVPQIGGQNEAPPKRLLAERLGSHT